jgi:hypothetical protein
MRVAVACQEQPDVRAHTIKNTHPPHTPTTHTHSLTHTHTHTHTHTRWVCTHRPDTHLPTTHTLTTTHTTHTEIYNLPA